MGEIKRRAVTTEGYVVRGKDRQGQAVTCWTEDGAAVHEVIAPRFSSPDVANTALRAMARRGCTDVGIFRVHADGREERLPSYEEALAEIERLRAQLGAARQLAAMAQKNVDVRDLGEAMPHEWFVLCGVLEDGIGSEARRLLETTESRAT